MSEAQQRSLLDSIELKVTHRKNVPAQKCDGFDINPPKWLVASVEDFGVLEPLFAIENGDRYRICDGNRRLAAAIKAGLRWIPLVIYEDGVGVHETLALIGNRLRSDNPAHEALQVKALVDKGLTVDDVARGLHIHRRIVEKRLRIASLPVTLFDLLAHRKIAETTALEALKLEPEQRDSLVEQALAGERITLAKVRKMREVGIGKALAGLDESAFQAVPAVTVAWPVILDSGARVESDDEEWTGIDADGQRVSVRPVVVASDTSAA